MFVPCGRLSWLPVSFLLHVKYTLSYRIVYAAYAGFHVNIRAVYDAYLGEFDERHIVIEEKILEHFGSAHLSCLLLCVSTLIGNGSGKKTCFSDTTDGTDCSDWSTKPTGLRLTTE